MPAPRKYTPEMDAAILAAEGREGLQLLVCPGFSISALYARRKVLRGYKRPTRSARTDLFYRRTSGQVERVVSSTPVFARPSWFREDLTSMTKGGLR